METNNRKQLVTQDNGNIEKIFPKNYMSNIVNEETGESLRIFLLKYNHIDLGYRSSKSSARPTLALVSAGFKYYDTTLNKYIMSNGTAWTNLDGSALT